MRATLYGARKRIKMKKVIVIGCPGSGKSHFSRELHKRTGIPLYHLDMMYWNADKTTVSKEEFLFRLEEVLKTDEWIMDGNFSSTLEQRVGACNVIFFLDYPVDVCLDGVKARRGKKREDIPWIETEEDAEFTEYIKSFRDNRRPEIISLLERCPDKKVFIFKSRAEADAFLEEHDEA